MRFVSLCCVVLLTTSCVGTEIGNPPTPTDAQVSVDILGVDNAPDGAVLPTALRVSDEIEVDEAFILVGDLRFRHADPCGEAGADHTEAFVADLLADDVELNDLQLPAGTYCRLDIRPRRGGDDGFASDRPELDGLTAFASGTYQGNPFVARRESDDELSFIGNIELPAGEQLLFVAIDIPLWFDGIDFDGAETDADGRIVIGHEGSFDSEFKQNFERSIDVALDADGDRMLTSEDEERAGDDDGGDR